MDSHTGAVAETLGISVPRLHRLLDRLGRATPARPGAHRTLSQADVDAATRAVGAVPEHVAGLTREDMLVLAALSRSPFGLVSYRAVARVAGVSPTTAGNSITRLVGRGFVIRRRIGVIEGRPKELQVWQANLTGVAWPGIASTVGRVILPRRPRRPATRVPRRLAHLFWNADVDRIDLPRDARYVASRLLLSYDPEGLAWAAANLPSDALASVARLRGVSGADRALARNLAAGADAVSWTGLPAKVRHSLPEAEQSAWEQIVPAAPRGVGLAGGPALPIYHLSKHGIPLPR